MNFNNDDMKDGLKMIRDAFMKAVQGKDPMELKRKIGRMSAAGGKAMVERGLQEFPKQYVEQTVRDVYGFIAGRELADGVSMMAQSVSLENLQLGIDGFLDQLKSEEVSIAVAKQLKGEIDKDMVDGLKMLLKDKIDQMDGPQQAIARIVMEQVVEPAIEQTKEQPGRNIIQDMRVMLEEQLPNMPVWQQALLGNAVQTLAQLENAPVEEVASTIRDTVSNISADMIAPQIFALVQSITPDRVSAMTHKLVGGMPAPSSVSSVVTGIANAAVKQLSRAAEPEKADAAPSLAEFRQEVSTLLDGVSSNDNAKNAKIDLGKDKGKGFKFKL